MKSVGAQAIDDLFRPGPEPDDAPLEEAPDAPMPCCGRVRGSAHALDCSVYGDAARRRRRADVGTARETALAHYREHRALWGLAVALGLTPEALDARTRARFGVRFEALTPEQAAAMLPALRVERPAPTSERRA